MAEKIQCFGRLVDDKVTGYFGDGKHKFHLEIRCKKPALSETKLCGRCHDRPKEQQRNHPTMLHGFIDEPIPPWSHIFDGPWYKAKVGQYGVPSEYDMAKAKKAQLESTSTPTPVPMVSLTTVEIPSTPASVSASASASPSPSPVDSPKKKRISRQTSNTAVPPVAEIPFVPTLAIESNELILDEYEVVKIVVHRFEHEGTSYFLENKKQKVYSVGADGRPSFYVGNWNPRNKTIFTEISDSDFEGQ